MDMHVDIHESDREVRTVVLSGARPTIGRGARAALALPECEELAPEHVALEGRDEGCLVTVLPGAETPVLVEGIPHDGGVLPWGAQIQIGRVHLRLAREAIAPARKTSLLVVVAPLVLGVALWMIFSEPAEGELPRAPAAPALFAQGAARCDGGSAPARYRAERSERDADAKSQRYPFAPEDGVEAVRLYRRAGACFSDAGDAPSARSAAARADRMQRRVELDYRTSRFRLGRALEHGEARAALAETHTLAQLTRDRPGAYADWLVMLERRLRLAQPEGER